MSRQVVSSKDITEKIRQEIELVEELEYLRYFYNAIDAVVGSDDVYSIINEEYDGVIPEQYKTEWDEDED